jgi:hypothetical protein
MGMWSAIVLWVSHWFWMYKYYKYRIQKEAPPNNPTNQHPQPTIRTHPRLPHVTVWLATLLTLASHRKSNLHYYILLEYSYLLTTVASNES